MTRRGSLAVRFVLAGAAVYALAASPASADYKASYEKGIRAIDNKDWGVAIAAMRAASDENPREGERILIYGMRYKPYLPHYYMGLAYFNTGNCEAAAKAWAESERQGAVREMSEYATLRTLREQCRGQGVREPAVAQPPAAAPAPGPEVKRAIAEAEVEIRKAEEAATAVARLRGEPDIARQWQSEPALRRRENKGSMDLASARTILAEAKPGGDLARIAAARDAAIRASQELESLANLVERRDRLQREARDKEAREGDPRARQAAIERQAREKEAREKQAALDSQEKERQARERQAALDSQEKVRQAKEKQTRDELAAQQIRTVLAQVSLEVREARLLLGDASRRQPPLPDEVAKSRSDLEAVVGEARRAGPATPLSDLERLRKRLGNSRTNLRMALNRPPVVSPPSPERRLPAALLEGAVAYFQGDYEKAARTLEDFEFPDPRAAAQARLLRGAARYGVFVTGGEKDDRLRQQAVEDVRECVRLDSKIVVSPQAFSPRFVEFFKRSASNGG